MPSRALRVGAIAGVLSLGGGCLDPNPKFIEPSGTSMGGSTEAPTTSPTTTPTTTTVPPTTGETTDTTAMTTDGPSSSTAPPLGCGDGQLDVGEECDDGPANGDQAACTSLCKNATCGDGLVLAGVEECDEGAANSDNGTCTTTCADAVCGDGLLQLGVEECDQGAQNAADGMCKLDCTEAVCGDGAVLKGVEECDDANDNPQDGCLKCVWPRHCANVKNLADDPNALVNGKYWIDPDGPDPKPMLPVLCDMKTMGGGWTIIERSPRNMPIGASLFDPIVVLNEMMPDVLPYRMGKMPVGDIMMMSSELRIDCGGPDYLLTDAIALNTGEMMAANCQNLFKVNYKEAVYKGLKHVGELCTSPWGKPLMCGGAWNIVEDNQMLCGLPDFPWEGSSPPGANLFAVDPAIADPAHDCHQADAVREVKLR